MPKCADVQIQLGSDNLLQDIKDVAFFRKLQRLGSYTFGKALNNAMKQGAGPTVGGTRAKAQATRVRCMDRGGHCRQNLAERDSCWDKVLAFGVVFGSV